MPIGQSPLEQPQPDPTGLDAYMATYGQRLQSMLADPNAGQDPNAGPVMAPTNPPAESGFTDGGQPPEGPGLGPDDYRQFGGAPAPNSAPPPSVMDPKANQPAGAAPAGPGALESKGQDQQGGLSFRDLWKAQSKTDRQEYLDKLQNHLKQADQTIDSAYGTMMKQLGGRPQTDLSQSDKGMLLMEFGMRMMQNSSGRYGYGKDTGAAFGAAGVSTLQDAQGLKNRNLASQQRYDQMQQQLTIAQGKEKSALAGRSALEEGRDLRAFGQQDSMLARVDAQQQGANTRNDARITAAGDRVDTTEAGKDRRAKMGAAAYTHFTQDADGNVVGINRNGDSETVKGADGNPIKAPPGGLGGKGTRGTAAETNYNLYLKTYGVNDDGTPLSGAALQKAQQDALAYASNPRSANLSDAQMLQMASKSADSEIRANPLAWSGMNPDEINAKRTEIVNQEFQRLKRTGTAGPGAGGSPLSRAGGGAIPTQPTGRSPNSAQLALLSSNPKANAPYFLKKFGYLPKEFQQYATTAPASALSP